LKTGPIGCPQKSRNNYKSTLRNILEERRSNWHRRGTEIANFNWSHPLPSQHLISSFVIPHAFTILVVDSVVKYT